MIELNYILIGKICERYESVIIYNNEFNLFIFDTCFFFIFDREKNHQ
jgi:hypothetical protein